MVAMQEIEALSRDIVRDFDPERIVLFGSYAYGTPSDYSDVDVLVIMRFEGHPFDKAMEILDRLDPDFSADVVVRSPGDAARRYAECDPLIREAFDHGKVLYERNG
jgi:predicted nucleotidyltransferase